jgi:hypothetical protein
MRILLRAIWAIAMLWTCVSACSCKSFADLSLDNVPMCDPKSKDPCFCNMGTKGIRTCNDDGQDYGQCMCLDGGAPDTDAGQEEAGAMGPVSPSSEEDVATGAPTSN